MSHWQALAVKISSSSLRSPPHCSCTFTCRRGGPVFHSPSLGHLRCPSPLSLPTPKEPLLGWARSPSLGH